MSNKTNKIIKIKNFIKIIVASILCVLLVFLTFFVKHNDNISENSIVNKWVDLSDIQRVKILQHIVPEMNDNDLLIDCVNKIASLPDSENMIIRTAVSLCYNGIILNSVTGEQQ